MATPGQLVNDSRFVAESPERVSQAIIAATAGVPEYTVSAPGAGSILLSRQYRPTWTIVVAVIGALFFLIGLLALLVKNTEALTLTIIGEQGGTRITLSGVATSEMVTRLDAVIGSLGPGAKDSMGDLEAGTDTKVCPECAETIKAAATVCRFCGHSFTEISEPPA